MGAHELRHVVVDDVVVVVDQGDSFAGGARREEHGDEAAVDASHLVEGHAALVAAGLLRGKLAFELADPGVERCDLCSEALLFRKRALIGCRGARDLCLCLLHGVVRRLGGGAAPGCCGDAGRGKRERQDHRSQRGRTLARQGVLGVFLQIRILAFGYISGAKAQNSQAKRVAHAP